LVYRGAALRLQHTATPAVMISWQIIAIVVAGLSLAWLIGNAPAPIVLGAVLAFVLVVIFMERPDIGVLLLLLVRASTDASLGSFSSGLPSQQRLIGLLLSPNSALILILIVGGGLFLLRRGLRASSLPVAHVYGFLLLIGVIGVLRADNLVSSLYEWLRTASALIIYALVVNLFRNPERIQRAVDILAGSFVLPAIFGFYELALGQGRFLSSIGARRIDGTFGHPNPYGVYLLIVLSVFLCQALTQSGKRKWLSLSIVAASSMLLVATYARSVWVGLVVVLVVVGVFQGRRLLLLAPLILVAALRAIPSIGARLENPMSGSFANRQGIWETLFQQWTYVTSQSQSSVAIALDRLTGLGPGSFVPLMSLSQSAVAAPHNDYLRVLIESGIFGLVLFILLYVILIRLAYRTWRRSSGPMAALALSLLAVTLAYSLMSITDNLFAMTANQVYFWALAGLVTAISEIRDGNDASPSGGQQGELA